MVKSSSVVSDDDATVAPLSFNLPGTAEGTASDIFWPTLHEIRLAFDRKSLWWIASETSVLLFCSFGLAAVRHFSLTLANASSYVTWALFGVCGVAFGSMLLGIFSSIFLQNTSNRAESDDREQSASTRAALCAKLLCSCWPLLPWCLAVLVSLWEVGSLSVPLALLTALFAMLSLLVLFFAVPLSVNLLVTIHPMTPTMHCSVDGRFALGQHATRVAMMLLALFHFSVTAWASSAAQVVQLILSLFLIAFGALQLAKVFPMPLLKLEANYVALGQASVPIAIALWLTVSGNFDASSLWIAVVCCLATFAVSSAVMRIMAPRGSKSPDHRSSQVTPRMYQEDVESPIADEEAGVASPRSDAGDRSQQTPRYHFEAELLLGNDKATCRHFLRMFLRMMHTSRHAAAAHEDIFRILEEAMQRWPRNRELQIVHAATLADTGLPVYEARIARVIDHSAFIDAPISQRFVAFSLYSMRMARSLSLSGSSNAERRRLVRQVSRLSRFRSKILGLQGQFWKTMLVDSHNVEFLSSLTSQMNELDLNAQRLLLRIERDFRGNPSVLREKARYVSEVYGDGFQSMSLLATADAVEEKLARYEKGLSRKSVEKAQRSSMVLPSPTETPMLPPVPRSQKRIVPVTLSPTDVPLHACSPSAESEVTSKLRWDAETSEVQESASCFGDDMASDGVSSTETAMQRSSQLRHDFLSRPSIPVRKTRRFLVSAVIVLALVLTVLFVVCMVIVQIPLTHIDTLTSVPLEDTSAALSHGFEIVNRMKIPISTDATSGRLWLDDLLLPGDRVVKFGRHEGALRQLLMYIDRLQEDKFPTGVQGTVSLSSFAGVDGAPYVSWNASVLDIKRTAVPQTYAQHVSSMLACVKANQYQINGTASRSKACTAELMFAAYNGNSVVWSVLESLSDAYGAELEGKMIGIVSGVSVVAAFACGVVICMVVFGVVPNIRKVLKERNATLHLLSTVDKNSLKNLYEDCKTKSRADRHSAVRSSRDPSSANGTSSSLRLSSLPFVFTIMLVLLYGLSFVVLLAVYINDLYTVNRFIAVFPSIQSSAVRTHGMILELISPEPSPYGNDIQLRQLVKSEITSIASAWDKLSHELAFQSDTLHATMLRQMCTRAESDATLPLECRSLDEVIIQMQAYLNVFVGSTDPADFSISSPAFRNYQPLMFEYLPVKINIAYNAFVTFYNDRAAALRAVAIALFVFAILAFPLAYYLGVHRPMGRVEHDHMLLRKVFLLIPLSVAEGNARIWAFITGSEPDHIVLASAGHENNPSKGHATSTLPSEMSGELILAAAEAFFSVDAAKGFIVFANPAACELTGRSTDQLLGMHFEDLLVESLEFRRLVTASSGNYNLEAILDGTACPVKMHVSIASSKRNYIIVTMRDMTLESKQTALLAEEKKKGLELLHSILPPPVASRLMRNERPIAFSHDSVCTLFCDIVGFTPLTSRQSATETVTMLDTLFSRFDDVAKRNRISRIKTIGDCAMLACGITVDGVSIDPGVEPGQRRNLVKDMCEAAKEMLLVARDLGIQVRLGLNIGPAISGVIGRDKFQFDVWGDSVNVASRMESTSEPMKIHLSRAAYEHVYDCYPHFEEREVDVKGKGRMQTYLLSSLM